MKRRFLGNLMGPYQNQAEKNLEKKHLKAYLQGKEYFHYGKDKETYMPIRYLVLQEFYEK